MFKPQSGVGRASEVARSTMVSMVAKQVGARVIRAWCLLYALPLVRWAFCLSPCNENVQFTPTAVSKRSVVQHCV